MDWVQACVLGIVQGLTEFLPISSTAHVRISSALFGWSDPGAAFTAVTQIGTESAVLIYFRKDIAAILRAWFSSLRRPMREQDPLSKLGWYVIIGTIPIAVLGYTFQSVIETSFRNLYFIAIVLILFSFVIAYFDKRGTHEREIITLRARDAVILGFAQSLALIPGVSRSGGTIAIGLALGLKRAAAARYSFLLAIPAVLGAGFYEFTKIGESSSTPALGPTLIATALAFVTGYAAIAWLLRFISTHSFGIFVRYRIALGVLILILLSFGVISEGGVA
jgi:undecaprenyl-diphosphatase